MTSQDFIIEMFCRVDDQMRECLNIPRPAFGPARSPPSACSMPSKGWATGLATAGCGRTAGNCFQGYPTGPASFGCWECTNTGTLASWPSPASWELLTPEDCTRALALARRAAVPAAAKSADDLAAALSVKRGGVLGAVESPAGFGFDPFSSDGCGSSGQFRDSYDPRLLPFDAEPKTEVSVNLQVTYAIE